MCHMLLNSFRSPFDPSPPINPPLFSSPCHFMWHTHTHTIKRRIINSPRLKTSCHVCMLAVRRRKISARQRGGIRAGDKRTDSICFAVSVGSPVLIANARRQRKRRRTWQRSRGNFFFFPSFTSSLPFFFLYAPGVNKREGPVAIY